MEPLTEAEIAAAVTDSEWVSDGVALTRVIERATFLDVVALVQEIAQAAEAAGHHPDLRIYAYRRLEVRLSTHDVGAITQRDLDLAQTIDGLA